MLERGIIKEIPQNINNGWKFVLWIMVLFHRYHYPYFILMLIIEFILAYTLKDIQLLLLFLVFVEIFYLSIAFHEASHISFAKFINVKTVSISMVPYSMDLRVNFSKERKIQKEDLYGILFAGPMIPIITAITLILIAKIFTLPFIVYICCIEFSLINIMSLLPLRDSDGGRILEYIKQKPQFIKILFASLIYYLYKKSRLEDIKNLIVGG